MKNLLPDSIRMCSWTQAMHIMTIARTEMNNTKLTTLIIHSTVVCYQEGDYFKQPLLRNRGETNSVFGTDF